MSGVRYSIRRQAIVLALLMASFAASERAQAKCEPDAGSNVTATCTGTTLNQNPPAGFGTGNETNLNTTVVQDLMAWAMDLIRGDENGREKNGAEKAPSAKDHRK